MCSIFLLQHCILHTLLLRDLVQLDMSAISTINELSAATHVTHFPLSPEFHDPLGLREEIFVFYMVRSLQH
jgi:hypothetical protein